MPAANIVALAGASLLVVAPMLKRVAAGTIVLAGTGLMGWALGEKLYCSWPMLVAFQEPSWCAMWMGLAAGACIWRGGEGLGRWAAGAGGVLGWTAGVMPGDFYLPMVRSATVWAHAHLLLSTAAMACMLVGALGALRWVCKLEETQGFGLWLGWGLVLYTLGTFCAQVWGYLGWGTTVVWEDEGVVGAMAVWFYYAAAVHLHLCRGIGPRARAWLVVVGGVMVVGLRIVPALGPVQWPGGW